MVALVDSRRSSLKVVATLLTLGPGQFWLWAVNTRENTLADSPVLDYGCGTLTLAVICQANTVNNSE